MSSSVEYSVSSSPELSVTDSSFPLAFPSFRVVGFLVEVMVSSESDDSAVYSLLFHSGRGLVGREEVPFPWKSCWISGDEVGKEACSALGRWFLSVGREG